MRPLQFLTAAILLATIPVTVFAQQNVPLTLEIHNDSTPRSNGPVPLDIELTWGGSTILEGKLVLTFKDGPLFYGRAVSHDLALNVGRNRFNLLLPTLDGKSAYNSVNVLGTFVTEKSEIDLDVRPLRVARPEARVFRLLYCDPTSRGSDRTVSNLMRSLSFGRFWRPYNFDPQVPVPSNPNLSTLSDVYAPDDMPQNPHWFCSYNIVVLSQSGFTGLRNRQLESLAQWIKAGGSLVVEPMGGLEQRQLDFLNGLSASEKDRFTTGPDGHLDVPESREYETIAAGLGQVAVMYRTFTDLDFKTPDWNELVAQLWHFRSDQLSAARAETRDARFEWLPLDQLLPSQQNHRNNQNHYYGYNNYQVPGWQHGNDLDDLRVRELKSGQGLLDKLMPSEVEVVPLSYIGLILLFYVLTIGPLDYFVLGALRLRRFTWITFPAATVAFTLFTVWLSHSFLDASTERSQIRVFDMADDGSVLRSNRIELLFTMSSHNVVSEQRSSLFTAMSHSRFGGNMYDYRYGRNMARETVPPPTVQGRPPGVYQVVQEMPQWTPQMNRVFAIAPEADTLPNQPGAFDWNKSWNFSDDAERKGELAEMVRAAFGQEAQAWLYNQRDMHLVCGNKNSFFPISTIDFNHWQMQQQVQQAGGNIEEVQQLGQRQVDFLSDISVRLQGRSLFGIVSQIAPHGGDNFEDLAILDPSEPNEWLLVVLVPNQEDIRIYRHLYHVNESQ